MNTNDEILCFFFIQLSRLVALYDNPPNHLKAVPRYYHVISVATEVKLHCFRGRGTTAAMAVDLFFCSFPSPRKCQGSKFFLKNFLAAKALIICNSKPFEVYLFFHFRGSGSNLFFCSLPWSRQYRGHGTSVTAEVAKSISVAMVVPWYCLQMIWRIALQENFT